LNESVRILCCARVSYLVHRNGSVHARDGCVSREYGSITWKRWATNSRACLLVFLLFSWGRKPSVLCLTLHVKLGVILRSVYFILLINHIIICKTQLLHTSIFLSTMNLTGMIPQLRLFTRGHYHGMARRNHLQSTRIIHSPALLAP
jgi:hypothetical protein